MADKPDVQMQLGEGQSQPKSEPLEISVPISTTPLEPSSDFYNTPLTGQTPVYPSDNTTSSPNENISKFDTLTTSAPAIPGLTIMNEDDKPALSTEGQDTENTRENGDAVNEVAGVSQPNVKAEHNEGAPTTDAMETDQTAADQPMTTEEEHPEWEVDSSPYESSSDSSTDSSDDSDEDEEDYPILSAEETARMLMQAEGGSDDEGDNKAGGGSFLRTANEQIEDAQPIPDIKVTEDMKIVPLGYLESHVENLILIKATVSGDYQVLESNSLLCLEDRTVIGVVADTLGRVEEPLYTVRYQDPTKIQELGLEKGKQIFYVESHSEFVFTQPLKGMKGSDASNFHDEEVAEDEIEFSDDEAETEYKRRLKQKKKERKETRGDGAGGKSRNAPGPSPLGRGELNYDDAGDREVEDGYTPLARPQNYHEIMNHPEARTESSSYQNNRGNFRGRGRGRGGFERGSGRGRGNDRRGRGNYHNNYSQDNSHRSDQSRENSATPQFQNYPASTAAFPAQQYGQYPSFPQPQQQPQFPSFGQAQTAGMPQFPFLMPYQQNTFQQNPYQNVPAGAHINPAFFAALQQLQQPQQQQQQQQSVAPPAPQNQRAPNNQSTFNQVQAQLDILRQLTGGAGNANPPQ